MNKNKLKEVYANHRIGNLQMNIYTYTGYIPYHWHDEYEFIRVLSGNCECIVNGETVRLSPNEAILIHCGELHTVKPADGEGNFEFFAVVVHPYVIFGTDCNQFYDPTIRFKRLYYDKQTLNLLDTIFDAYMTKQYGYEMVMKSYIINIFSRLYATGYDNIKEAPHDKEIDRFSNIIEYIHTNYSRTITLEQLQKLYYCSASYIIQLFKKNTGKTPVEYINSYRIYKSIEILLSGNKSVLEISLECGFENVGYFIKTFKKQMGLTPLQYKKHSQFI